MAGSADRLEVLCRFAVERHAMWQRRLAGEPGPWTTDAVLASYRFTNAFRAVDRVSQYLIANVIDDALAPPDLVLRVTLFRFFNRIDTWQYLVSTLGVPTVATFDPQAASTALSQRRSAGGRVYSNAYIVPPVPGRGPVKHHGHVQLAYELATGPTAEAIASSSSLRELSEVLLGVPGLGRFLAFQLAIDLAYSDLVSFSEAGFVIAGPGALDGLSKVAPNVPIREAEDTIVDWADHIDDLFGRFDLEAPTLCGRALQPIDVQNLLCEISKYTRVAHPDWVGRSGRTRIKQQYRADPEPLAPLVLPAKWNRSTSAS